MTLGTILNYALLESFSSHRKPFSAVSDRFDYVGAESCFESLRVKLERQLIGFVVRFRDLPTPCILSPMPSKATFRESRRSTRVPLKVVIAIEGGAESRTCEGETIVVNLHGALISTAFGLCVGMRLSVHVYLTDKRAGARVVYIDPKNPPHCGIELDEPRNIWGVPLPPDDWEETAALEIGH